VLSKQIYDSDDGAAATGVDGGGTRETLLYIARRAYAAAAASAALARARTRAA